MTKWKYGQRLKTSAFDIPVDKIKSGWYSDKYFVRTKRILEKDNNHTGVLMQVFCRENAISSDPSRKRYIISESTLLPVFHCGQGSKVIWGL